MTRLRPYFTNRKALILSYEMAKQDNTTMPKMIPFRDSYDNRNIHSVQKPNYTPYRQPQASYWGYFPSFDLAELKRVVGQHRMRHTIKALWDIHRYWWCRSLWVPGCPGQSRILELELAAWRETITVKLQSSKCTRTNSNYMPIESTAFWGLWHPDVNVVTATHIVIWKHTLIS